MHHIWTLRGADEKGASTIYDVPTVQDQRGVGGTGRREREKESQGCITQLGHGFNEPEEKNGGNKMYASRTFDDAGELRASTMYVSETFKDQRRWRDRRRKGCVGEREREYVMNVRGWQILRERADRLQVGLHLKRQQILIKGPLYTWDRIEGWPEL